MSFDTNRYLSSVAEGLMGGAFITPQTTYQGSSLATFAMLCGLVNADLDAAAERLVAENAALRGLFRDAADQLARSSLHGRLEAAAEAREASIRLSELRASNDELRGLLIELHEYVEEHTEPAAQHIEAAIWAELARMTERLLPEEPK